MARLIAALIRHGDYHQLADTPSAHQPFPLTAKGKQQARHAANIISRDIQEHGWMLCPELDCSQLLRAWQTADILRQEFISLSLATDQQQPFCLSSFDNLAERGLGSAANLTTTQIKQVIEDDLRFTSLPKNWKSHSHYRLPLQGAESLMDAGQRVAGHITERMLRFAETDEDTVVVFVGHGAAFRHAAYHLGVLGFDQIAQLSMYHAKPVYLERYAGGQWKHVAGEWKVRKASTDYTD